MNVAQFASTCTAACTSFTVSVDKKMQDAVAGRKNLVNVSRTEFEARVSNLDLDPIVVKLMDKKEGQGWSLEYADERVKEYKCFMILNFLYPEHVFVPTHDIDLVWHQHVLDTDKYSRDCEMLFATNSQKFLAGILKSLFSRFGVNISAGLFFDHFPYFGMRGEQDAANLQAGYAETQKMFMQEFGISILPAQAQGCIKSCHWCTSVGWTERPMPTRK